MTRHQTKSRRRGASMVGFGLTVALIAIVALGSVDGLGRQISGVAGKASAKLSQVNAGVSLSAAASQPGAAGSGTSCRAILDAGGSVGDGVYQIDPDGAGGMAPFDVYCDMTSAGGGWTMVAAQYEADPVTNWDEGIQADYDPTLATARSFALSSAELPGHTQTAFGQDTLAADVDYIDFVYTTGNIPRTLVSGLASANSYHVHRSTGAYYDNHDPEQTHRVGVNLQWANTLTFDRTGGAQFTWSFSPLYTTQWERGFGYDGGQVRGTNQSYAWTVWVR